MTDAAISAGDRTRKVLAAGAWTMVERVVSQAAQFVIFIVAARVLGPAEFGVFALVSACAILLLRASEVGWAPYIMSWSGDATVPQQVLGLALLSGLAFGLIGAGAGLALPLAGLEDWIAPLVLLFALWVCLATASAAQKGVMIWQGRLRGSAAAEITGEVAGLVVAVAALFSGWGVFALAFGRLAYQSVHLSISFGVTRLAPRLGLKGTMLRELWTFSAQIFVSRMIINLRLYLATFIIGGFLGPTAVGYYRAADRLVSALSEVITVPAQILAWSLFRQARDAAPARADGTPDLSGFQAQANVFYKMLAAVALPVFLWLIVMSEEVITGLLSEEWAAATPLVAILALSRVFFLPGVATEPVMSIVGETRRLPLFTGIFFAISAVVTLIGANIGLYAVAWSQTLVSAFFVGATAWLFARHAQIDWRGVLAASSGLMLPLVLGVGTLLALDRTPHLAGVPDLLRAVGFGLIAAAVYVAVLAWRDPSLARRLRRGGKA